MSSQMQLEQWVLGNSIHNNEDDECCPDFSCCNKKVVTSREVRDRFAKAVADNDNKTQMKMLSSFLKQGALTMGKKVYVAGVSDKESE